MSFDPLAVTCPDCRAPAGEDCRVDNPMLKAFGHAGRYDVARRAAAEHGTCRLCGRELLRLVDPESVFHPVDVEPFCPPEPSLEPYDNHGWIDYVNAGNQRGRPGSDNFIPNEESHAAPDSDEAAPADTD